MSEDVTPEDSSEENKPKKGRPKGSKNKPKRGRPKKKVEKPRGRPKKDRSQEPPKVKKVKIELLTDEEIESQETSLLNSNLDDTKLVEPGYNTSTEKIINLEPIDSSYYYRGSKHIPVAGAQYEFTADMVEELRRCKEDIIYFAENFFYIVTLDRGKEKIRLYQAQKRMLITMVESRFSANLASRQSGKTSLLTIFALWMVCFNEDYRIAIVANKESTAINIFKRVRMAYEQLPNYIKPGVKDYGKTGMTLGNDSSIIVSTTTATSVRGDSLNCISGDSKVLYKDDKNWLYEFTLNEMYKNNCEW